MVGAFFTPEEGFMQIGKKQITLKMSAAVVAKIAVLTAISFVLYLLKFNLPFMFPSFLEMQFSELPAMLAGFSMGPVAGVLVVVFKCLLKLPLTSTAYVGELTDIIIGVAYVLPASIIYRLRKDRKHAFIGISVGTAVVVVAAVLINRFISIPFYTEMMFGGNFGTIVGICSAIYPNATEETFYAYYLGLGIVPFNLLRTLIMSALTFLLYKKLSRILHWEGQSLIRRKLTGEYDCDGEEETFALAKRVADTLKGGETVLLEGDLGAGKTTFTKGLAKALGVTEEVTSPTFTILNIYNSGRLPLYHADMYRVTDEDETYELGLFEDAPDNAVFVVEWNKSGDLTERVIDVKITAKGDTERHFVISDSAENKDGGKQKPAAEVSESDADGDDGESCGAPEAEDGHSETPAAE